MIFQLKPSDVHGVGVFATADIKKDAHLPLFEDDDHRFTPHNEIKDSKVPEHILHNYSINYEGEGLSSPRNFNRMSVGWFLNHSENPNAVCDENYSYSALRNIKSGDEITIDYDKL